MATLAVALEDRQDVFIESGRRRGSLPMNARYKKDREGYSAEYEAEPTLSSVPSVFKIP
jgi:hypothetical protein